jgi:hypothetical protein
MKVQNYHKRLSQHLVGTKEPPSPDTKLFLESREMLIEEVGPQSIVENCEELLFQIGYIYRGLTMCTFSQMAKPLRKKLLFVVRMLTAGDYWTDPYSHIPIMLITPMKDQTQYSICW